jgi:hypothetical protein
MDAPLIGILPGTHQIETTLVKIQSEFRTRNRLMTSVICLETFFSDFCDKFPQNENIFPFLFMAIDFNFFIISSSFSSLSFSSFRLLQI